jgi:hypothetical protein
MRPRIARGVARAGSDLEHAVARREPGRGSHQRDDIGLRDGLTALDRERRILVGELLELGREECLARHRAERLEQAIVADAARDELAPDHLLPLLRALRHATGAEQERCQRGGRSGRRRPRRLGRTAPPTRPVA